MNIRRVINLVSNMGLKYVLFRLFFTLKSKLGFQKLISPINPKIKKLISLENWKNELPPFFFQGKKILI